MLPSHSPSLLARIAGGLVLLLLVGCGGGSLYTLNEGQVAERFIPPERTVHHPDTLRALTVTEEEGKIQYQLERDYQSLVEKWSSTFQNLGPGRSVRSRTFATYQSLELALVSLQPEMGIQTLRKERAQQLIEERRKTYFGQIRIDVYWFTGRGTNGIITGPGARIELRIGDRTIRPVQEDHGPLREAYVSGGDVALYRLNTLIFPRTVEGTDVLEGASRVELVVRRTGASSRERFTWEWRERER